MPLHPRKAAYAAHVARVTGTAPQATCPWAPMERAPSHVVELLDAIRATHGEGGMPWDQVLGREPSPYEVRAFGAFRAAQGEVLADDRRQAALERERHQKK